jgi:type I restriction enzyme S subunit
MPEYLEMFLQSGAAWTAIDHMKSGSSESGLNLTHERFRQLVVPIAPLADQEELVSVLSGAMQRIAAAESCTKTNLQSAADIVDSQIDCVFGQASAEAPRRPLSTVLAVQPRNGWSPPAKYQTGEGVPVLTLSSVTGFRYDGSRVKLSNAPTVDDAHYWLRDGELLMTRSNTEDLVGHVAIYDGHPERAICPDLIIKMTVDPAQATTRYIYYFLRSGEARAYLSSRAHGANPTMKKLSKKVVQDISVPLPPLGEQASVVAMLDGLTQRAESLQSIYRRRLTALSSLRATLLTRAFSGQLLNGSE